MLNFSYTNDFDNTEIYTALDDRDANLTEVVAKFVDLTRMIGYTEGSWDKLVEELSSVVEESNYTIYDWASDVLCDFYVRDHDVD